tara:strand:+ start:27 stop:1418 length:1392 start_codon:yes stop_codon:yes gene_type:complete
MEYRKQKDDYKQDLETYVERKIGLDLSFQSKGRWSQSDEEDLFVSLMEGDVISQHVLVNLEKASVNAEKETSKKLFKKHIKKGSTDLSIDSNNRNQTYKKIMSDKVLLKPGTYLDLLEKQHVITEPTPFSKLPKPLQMVVRTYPIPVIEYWKIERRGCKNVFKRVNKGVNLNDQEQRNAEASDIAEYVRNYATKYEDTFKTFMSDKKIMRRGNDQLIAQCVYLEAIGNETNPSNAPLNQMYNPDDARGVVLTKSWDITEKILNKIMKMIKDNKSQIEDNFKGVSWFIDLYNFVSYLSKNNIRIDDNDKLFIWFTDSQVDRIGSTEILYEWVTKPKGKKPYTIKETFQSLSGSQKDFCLTTRNEKILSDFYNTSNLLEDGVVFEIPSDDYFTYQDKLELWERQDGFAYCPKTNKPTDVKIPKVELFNFKKWQADAIIPRGRGGYHTLDNGQLTSASDNQSAGLK